MFVGLSDFYCAYRYLTLYITILIDIMTHRVIITVNIKEKEL